MREKMVRATERPARVAFWKHDFFRRSVEGGEQLWDEAAFGGTGLTGRDEVTNNGVNPGHFIDAEDDARPRMHLQLVHRSAGENVAINFHPLHHVLAKLFLDDALHCFGDKLQVALISDLEFDLVPDVGKERP